MSLKLPSNGWLGAQLAWAVLALAVSGCYTSDGKYDAAVAERTRVSALYAATASCKGLGDYCSSSGSHCCADMACGSSDCCVVSGKTCFDDKDCCGGLCSNGVCAASGNGGACLTAADCGGEGSGTVCVIASAGSTGKCLATVGGTCDADSKCTSHKCGADSKCACVKGSGSGCSDASDCCTDYKCYYVSGTSGSTWCKKPAGSPCSGSGECTSFCDNGYCE